MSDDFGSSDLDRWEKRGFMDGLEDCGGGGRGIGGLGGEALVALGNPAG
jgi:hypothetical protein